jgi:putative transposase
MHRSHRIRLDPTNKQRTQLQRSAGVARFAYNWALATWQEEYCLHCEDQDHPTPNQYSLRKQLNDIKKQDYPWMLEVNKCAPQEAIINLGKAFTSFFNKRSGYPRYKKRGVHDSFQVTGDRLRVKDKAIYISRIGWIRMTEPLRFSDAKMINVTISKTANHWYASILVEIPEITTQPKTATSSIVGVDLGVKDLATLSIGEKIPATNSHKRSLKRLRRLNQELHRRQTGSNNQRKAKIRLARAHARVASQRNDTLHKLSHRLINDFDVVAIEDLNVAGMVKNHKLTNRYTPRGGRSLLP